MTEAEIKALIASEVEKQLAVKRTENNIEVIEEAKPDGFNQKYRAILKDGKIVFQHAIGASDFEDITNGIFEDIEIAFMPTKTKSASSKKYTANNFIFRKKEDSGLTKSAALQETELKIDNEITDTLEMDSLIAFKPISNYDSELNKTTKAFEVSLLNGLYTATSLGLNRVYHDDKGYLRIVI